MEFKDLGAQAQVAYIVKTRKLLQEKKLRWVTVNEYEPESPMGGISRATDFTELFFADFNDLEQDTANKHWEEVTAIGNTHIPPYGKPKWVSIHRVHSLRYSWTR